jgi:hypothetical protein
MLNQSLISYHNKKIKIIFRSEIMTTKSVASFEELIRFLFREAELEYFPDVPAGADPKLECKNWFNFWFEDANCETYEIKNEDDFQKCLKTYA